MFIYPNDIKIKKKKLNQSNFITNKFFLNNKVIGRFTYFGYPVQDFTEKFKELLGPTTWKWEALGLRFGIYFRYSGVKSEKQYKKNRLFEAIF